MPNKPKPNYSKYVTPSSDPDCVKYWDRELKATALWMDWTLLKTMLKMGLEDIKSSLGVEDAEANQILWTAFIEATCGDRESPCYEHYKNFMRTVDEYHFAYWTPRLTIGSDIHDGFSEKVARQRYANWLNEDIKNPIFGKYKVGVDLSITEIKLNRRRKK